VARLAGLPPSLIERARDILKNLESAEYNEYGLPSLSGTHGGSANAAQMDLFSRGQRREEESVLEELRRTEPDRLTPVDALMRIAAWKERLRKGTS